MAKQAGADSNGLVIFGGGVTSVLTGKICAYLGVPQGRAIVSRFPDPRRIPVRAGGCFGRHLVHPFLCPRRQVDHLNVLRIARPLAGLVALRVLQHELLPVILADQQGARVERVDGHLEGR